MEPAPETFAQRLVRRMREVAAEEISRAHAVSTEHGNACYSAYRELTDRKVLP